MRIIGGQLIEIKRAARTSDGQGGFVEGLTTIATERGHLRPASSTEIVRANQSKGRVTHVAYIRAGSDVEFGDHLEVSNPLLELEVTGVRRPANSQNAQLEIDCKAVKL